MTGTTAATVFVLAVAMFAVVLAGVAAVGIFFVLLLLHVTNPEEPDP